MFKRLRVSPAMLVAIVALVAAVGGTAIAAGPAVTAAKKKKHADAKQDKKQFNSLLKKAAPHLTVAAAGGAAQATNAQHAVSADTATSAGSAQPKAFAEINGDGTVAFGKGIANANVTHPSDGTYCISGLSFTIRGANVTPNFGGGYNASAFFSVGSTGFCANGGQVILSQSGNSTTSSQVPGDEDFSIVVYG